MEVPKVHRFGAVRYEKGGVEVLSVYGEVDLYSAHRLKVLVNEAITRSGEISPRRVVVDLRAVEFIDTTGLGVLLEEQTELQKFAGELSVVAHEGGPVGRLLKLTGLEHRLNVYAEPNAALMEGSAALA